MIKLRNSVIFCALLAMPSSVVHSSAPAEAEDDAVPLDCPQIQQRKSKINPMILIHLVKLPYQPYGRHPVIFDQMSNINPKKTFETKNAKEKPLAICFSIPWRNVNIHSNVEWLEGRIKCKNNYTGDIYWLEADKMQMTYENNYQGPVFRIQPRSSALDVTYSADLGGEESELRYGYFKNDAAPGYWESAYKRCRFIIQDKNGKAMCSPSEFQQGASFFAVNEPINSNMKPKFYTPSSFSGNLKTGKGSFMLIKSDGKWRGEITYFGISRFNVYHDTVIAISYQVVEGGFYCSFKKAPKLGF